MKKFTLILLSALLISSVFMASCGTFTIGIPGLNQPPVAYIDSIEPSPASEGQTVTFEGHGTDADGSIVAYRWRSSIDGDLSTRANFEKSDLSAGQHIIYFKVQDNTGDWSLEDRQELTVTGSATGLPIINTFIANPASISAGASSTLSWEVSGATSVSIDQGIGSVAVTGSRLVAPPSTIIYKLTATNSAGSSSATCQVLVSGSVPSSYPVINFFVASATSVSPGETVTLSWSVANATAVTIAPGIGTVALSGSMSLIPTMTTNFTLTATNSAGSAMQTIMISVAGITPFQVTRVLSTGVPASGTYPCPYNIVFTFEIRVNGPGVVSYYTERSDGTIGPTKSMLFDAMGSKFLTSTWSVSSSGTYWEKLHITSPNTMSVQSSPVTVTCASAFAVTSVINSGAPASGSRPCPYTMNFTFNITTNGAGIVSYHIEQSNGFIGPTKSMSFTTAGTKSLTSSWTTSASGTYWVKLVITAPNSISATSVPVTLSCE